MVDVQEIKMLATKCRGYFIYMQPRFEFLSFVSMEHANPVSRFCCSVDHVLYQRSFYIKVLLCNEYILKERMYTWTHICEGNVGFAQFLLEEVGIASVALALGATDSAGKSLVRVRPRRNEVVYTCALWCNSPALLKLG